jgi:plasmid stability protein
MPEELKVLVRSRAKSHGRTMNAEICIILQRAVADGYRLSLED